MVVRSAQEPRNTKSRKLGRKSYRRCSDARAQLASKLHKLQRAASCFCKTGRRAMTRFVDNVFVIRHGYLKRLWVPQLRIGRRISPLNPRMFVSANGEPWLRSEKHAELGTEVLLPCVLKSPQCEGLHSIKWYRGPTRIFIFSEDTGIRRSNNDIAVR